MDFVFFLRKILCWVKVEGGRGIEKWVYFWFYWVCSLVGGERLGKMEDIFKK